MVHLLRWESPLAPGEGGDLVVVEVGGDESLGGEAAGYVAHMVAGRLLSRRAR